MLPERLDQRATAWPALAKANIPPTLDGSAFLRYVYPGEYQAIAWIQAHVAGTPAILQSRYGGYGNLSARVTMFTGMPSVVNWGFEAAQQRYNLQDAGDGRVYPEQVGLRERDVVDTIYTTTDQRQALALLRRYHVGYVYIGTQERGDPALTTITSAFHGYPPRGLAKFAAMAVRGTLTQVYNWAGIQIYQVSQRSTAAGTRQGPKTRQVLCPPVSNVTLRRLSSSRVPAGCGAKARITVQCMRAPIGRQSICSMVDSSDSSAPPRVISLS